MRSYTSDFQERYSMNPIAIRLLNQQLASPVFSDPADVVSHMGAIQAQEYRLMRWAVAMRTQKPSSQAFTKAYNEGRIIRLHLLRGTWQLVASEDYAWMLQLCAPKSISVIKGWMHSNGIDIPQKEFVTISDILCRTAEENGSVTKEDFVEALSHKGITMDDHRLSYHIRMAELNGLLCSGNLLPTKATYSLAPHKVSPHPNTTNEDALLILTRKYFQSHSPATLKDFVWWSGMNIGDCRKSIEALNNDLQSVSWQGEKFYVHDSCRTRGFRKGQTLLMPSYDEYLIAYKSRDIVLPAEHSHRAHSNNGIFHPIIAHDGIICGNWKPFGKKLEATAFTPDMQIENINEAWKRYEQYQST